MEETVGLEVGSKSVFSTIYCSSHNVQHLFLGRAKASHHLVIVHADCQETITRKMRVNSLPVE